jgi:hypothetical protein
MRKAPLLLTLALLGGVGTFSVAQIKAYTLPEMVAEADGTVFGQIVAQRVFRVDDPIDGPELYFTTLTIEGRAVPSGSPVSIDVTYAGGFINEKEGVHNSEAPSADDVKIGNQVVAFYKWADDMGGGVSANALMAAHGGIFRTVAGLSDSVVLGRGPGYAIERNVKLSDLDKAVRDIKKN